jgi:hypothetical protein
VCVCVCVCKTEREGIDNKVENFKVDMSVGH